MKERLVGGDYYKNFYARTSKTYLKLVLQSLERRDISYYNAMKYLDTKMKSTERIVADYEEGKI